MPTQPCPNTGMAGKSSLRSECADTSLRTSVWPIFESPATTSVYGPSETWHGGREKAPATVCGKVAVVAITGDTEIEVWGDGFKRVASRYIRDHVHAQSCQVDVTVPLTSAPRGSRRSPSR